jgi:hypothetical protein
VNAGVLVLPKIRLKSWNLGTDKPGAACFGFADPQWCPDPNAAKPLTAVDLRYISNSPFSGQLDNNACESLAFTPIKKAAVMPRLDTTASG